MRAWMMLALVGCGFPEPKRYPPSVSDAPKSADAPIDAPPGPLTWSFEPPSGTGNVPRSMEIHAIASRPFVPPVNSVTMMVGGSAFTTFSTTADMGNTRIVITITSPMQATSAGSLTVPSTIHPVSGPNATADAVMTFSTAN